MGVGNLQHELIVEMISSGAQDDGIRLVDTARASQNEVLVKQAIESISTKKDNEFHVVTKVWYTHLGYERTKLSVQESLQELNSPNIKVHILLHWPKCRNDISWMDCEGEEARLPQYVKDAGPPPHFDQDNAFVESWRALEDVYDQNDRIVSIGVSNFSFEDFAKLQSSSRITPHMLQGNVWTLLFDPHLMKYLHDQNIHFQAYNVLNGIISQSSRAPNAYHSLVLLAEELSRENGSGGVVLPTPAQVVLAWLIQQDVSVIPRTSNPHHLQENAQTLQVVPRKLTSKQANLVETAVTALLRGVDLKQPTVTFHNRANEVAHVYWIHSTSGEHIPVKQDLQPQESFESQSYPGHAFVAMDESKSRRTAEFRVSAQYGHVQEFHIEL